jgi:flagellar basal body P-ring formation protein FlgA
MTTTCKCYGRERRLRILGATLIFIWWIGYPEASQAANRVTVIGRGDVKIAKDLILLADLAQIQGHDDQLVNRLAAIEIARAPLAGKTREFDLDQIRIRLRRHHIDLDSIAFQFERPVAVQRDQMEVSVEFIDNAVRKYLMDHLPWKKNDTVIKSIRFSGAARLPAGKLSYRIEAPKQTDYLGSVSLDMWFYINDRFRKRISVSAQIEVFADVVVAKKPIGKYEIIQKHDVELIRSELSRLPNRPASVIGDVVGKRALHPIYPHTVIGPNDVELPLVVRRGDVVKIIAETSGLCVTARGMVKENGRVGERVQVVNIDSQKTLHAQVLDMQTVKIDF